MLYIARLKAKQARLKLPDKIDYDLIQKAKMHIIRITQQGEFSDEISYVNSGKMMKRDSKLRFLDMYLDDCNILRVKNRAKQLNCQDIIVLPNECWVTLLIVRDMHMKYHHSSHETAINELKGKYYISRLRVLYKKVRRICQYCKNQDAKACVPQMAPLPKARLSAFERPFTYVGIDYFGPINVTLGRRSEKRWGVIFTCLTIRAVHIEVAHSLDTSSCIICLRNFVSRRGTPREIYTDNGTNFRATSKFLECAANNIIYEDIAQKFDTIKWKFNPPAAPHMGGAWERLVRSIKTVLHSIHPRYNFNDETLRSALLEVECVINSRPLTFVSLDHSDDEALTPNHLLLGSASGYKPIGNPNDSLRLRHRMTQEYADLFWRRWVTEYVPIISRRTKWFTRPEPLKQGDMVVIVDENMPRNTWPKGIVDSTITAKDGQVRRAIVKTQKGVFERPAAKLAVLDVCDKEVVTKQEDSITGGENVVAALN